MVLHLFINMKSDREIVAWRMKKESLRKKLNSCLLLTSLHIWPIIVVDMFVAFGNSEKTVGKLLTHRNQCQNCEVGGGFIYCLMIWQALCQIWGCTNDLSFHSAALLLRRYIHCLKSMFFTATSRIQKQYCWDISHLLVLASFPLTACISITCCLLNPDVTQPCTPSF